jgi:hypothetical protein
VTTDVAQAVDALEHLPDAPPETRNAVGSGLIRALGLGGRELPELPLEDFQFMAALGLIPNPPEEGRNV